LNSLHKEGNNLTHFGYLTGRRSQCVYGAIAFHKRASSLTASFSLGSKHSGDSVGSILCPWLPDTSLIFWNNFSLLMAFSDSD
jgi:hypothetical protein